MQFDFEMPVSQQVLQTLSAVDAFRGRWSSVPGLPRERDARLRLAARILSVGASCRLAGIRVSDHEVAGLLRGESVELGDAAEIRGYSAGLDHRIPREGGVLSVDDLRSLNAVALGAPPAEGLRSPFRERPLHVEAFDKTGKATGRVFPILPPHLVAGKTEELTTWLELELREGKRHPVAVIAIGALVLLAISPFERANGRVTRLMTNHLLIRAGYTFLPLSSLERHLESLRAEYQEARYVAQTGLWGGRPDLGPWFALFAKMLERHVESVETKQRLEEDALAFPPLQRAILEAVREHGNVSAGLLIRATGANRNTLKDNLRKLVQRGVLEKSGQRRGTRYRLASFDRARPARPEPD